MAERGLDRAHLQEELKKQNEWARAVVFDQSCQVLAATFQADPSELQPYLTALDSRDNTVGAGFVLGGDHFDVHRFHPPLVYGRRGGPDEGEGIALCRAVREGQNYYCVITYVLPILSARAVPQLIEYMRQNVGTVDIPLPS